MADTGNWQQGVRPSLSVDASAKTRRRIAGEQAAGAPPLPAAAHIHKLMLHRAVERANTRRADLLPDGAELVLVSDADTVSLQLRRRADRAVIHQSRPLHLSLISQSSVNGVIRDFLQYRSLKRYEYPV